MNGFGNPRKGEFYRVDRVFHRSRPRETRYAVRTVQAAGGTPGLVAFSYYERGVRSRLDEGPMRVKGAGGRLLP
jgi:hypothetical protein